MSRELEYRDAQGRTIKVETIDGVTRQSFITKPDANEYEFGRLACCRFD